MAPLLSIVIPTHKRAGILKTCLEHIARQTIADQLEVIVVSDGPDDETKLITDSGKLTVNIKFFDIPKSQQGVARNRGVKEATGKYILFIGDDIFLASDACERHVEIQKNLAAHSSQLIATLGHTTWDPACGMTPTMVWLEKSGWQFGYGQLTPHAMIDPKRQERFTYTSQISLPTDIAKKFPFREDVTLYGWEDIEWGFRLKEAGIGLYYESDAKALHHHHVTMEDSLKRMEILGKSAVIMDELNPKLKLRPIGFKLWKYRAAALFPNMRGLHSKAFLRGVSSPR